MAEPYILHKFKIQPTCHIDKELLIEQDVLVFLVEAKDDEGNILIFALLLQDIRKIHKHGAILHHYHQIGIVRFSNMKPCGIDMKRII